MEIKVCRPWRPRRSGRKFIKCLVGWFYMSTFVGLPNANVSFYLQTIKFQVTKCGRNPLTIFLAIRPYQSSLSVSLLNGIQCQYRADECSFFVGQWTLVCFYIGFHWWRSLIRPYLTSNSQDVLFVLLKMFVRWEVSGCAAIVLQCAAFETACSILV